MLKKFKTRCLVLVQACSIFMFSSSFSLAVLETDNERAQCAGYADAMVHTYPYNHYKLMSSLYGALFEKDGQQSADPSKLQNIYDDAYDGVDSEGRISDNLIQKCEDEYLDYMQQIKKEDLDKKAKTK